MTRSLASLLLFSLLLALPLTAQAKIQPCQDCTVALKTVLTSLVSAFSPTLEFKPDSRTTYLLAKVAVKQFDSAGALTSSRTWKLSTTELAKLQAGVRFQPAAFQLVGDARELTAEAVNKSAFKAQKSLWTGRQTKIELTIKFDGDGGTNRTYVQVLPVRASTH